MSTQLFHTCASVGLGLWTGGLTLFFLVVTPASFRQLPKEEAGRWVGSLLPAVDRWSVVWGTVTCGSLFWVFLNRHFEPRSLALELPVLAMFLLTLHGAYVLHPQIQDLRRKIALPEYQGTARLEKFQFGFRHLHRNSVRLQMLNLVLGWYGLGVLPRIL